MRPGTVIRCLTDNSIGIVISQSEDYLQVLFDDYKVMPMKINKVAKTGKFFDMSIIWDMVNGR